MFTLALEMILVSFERNFPVIRKLIFGKLHLQFERKLSIWSKDDYHMTGTGVSRMIWLHQHIIFSLSLVLTSAESFASSPVKSHLVEGYGALNPLSLSTARHCRLSSDCEPRSLITSIQIEPVDLVGMWMFRLCALAVADRWYSEVQMAMYNEVVDDRVNACIRRVNTWRESRHYAWALQDFFGAVAGGRALSCGQERESQNDIVHEADVV